MIVKPGVVIKHINSQMFTVIEIVDFVYATFGLGEARLTSCNDDKHMTGSLHYRDFAWDIGTKHEDGVQYPPDVKLNLASSIRTRLSDSYDVVMEPDHIHIEYDPKVKP